MTLSRTTVLTALVAALLGGCSAAGPAAGPQSASPPAPAPGAAWANNVCAASTGVQESVRRLAGAAQADPSSSATLADQVRAQVGERVTAVRQSAASLAATLMAVPTGVDPDVSAAQQQLQTAAQRLTATVGQLDAAAGQVSQAQTTADTATALVRLKDAVTATVAELDSYFTSLRAAVTSQTESVRTAFGTAPACAGPAPSSTA